MKNVRFFRNIAICFTLLSLCSLYFFYFLPKGILLIPPKNHYSDATYFRQTGIDKLPKIQLKIPASNPMSKLFLRELTKEPATNQLLFSFIEQSQTKSLIFDAGGHVGDTSLWLAQFAKVLNRPIKIITADPNKEKINFIKEVARLNELDNLIVVHTAVGDERSNGQEITSRKKQSSFFYKKIASPMYKVKPDANGPITIRTIDEIIESSDISQYPLRVLHLDVEGYEYLALQGAKNQIKENKPMAIIELSKETEKWITTAMSKGGYQSSAKISYEFNNTIFYSLNNKSHKSLLKSLDLLP